MEGLLVSVAEGLFGFEPDGPLYLAGPLSKHFDQRRGGLVVREGPPKFLDSGHVPPVPPF